MNNRVVYGGGGIMPDVFVSIDTTYTSKYYVKMVRHGIFNRFVLNYIDNNRAELEKKYKPIETSETPRPCAYSSEASVTTSPERAG